jgi:geranylgeranyl reductase family protein
VAAYWLARSGLEVLVLDRAVFPRVKACAAGVTAKAFDAVDYDLSPAFDGRVSRFVCRLRGKDARAIDAARPLVGMTHREVFDTYLLARAVEAGAAFAPATKVEAIAEEPDGVRLIGAGREIRGRYLVGADGATGVTARALGVRARKAPSAEVLLDRGTPRRHEDWSIVFDFAALPKGYGWIFPKARGASVGLGSLRPKAPGLRAQVERYAAGCGEPGAVTRFLGGTIPVARRGRARSARILLAGDAAAVADPFTGEGIAQAMRSGHAAAETIAAEITGRGDRKSYGETMRRLRREQIAGAAMASLLHAAPALFYRRLLAQEDVVRLFLKTLDGRATNTRWLSFLAEHPWRLLAPRPA